MAELHVQPKSGKPWWIWLLLAIVVIGLLYFLLGNRDGSTRDDDDHDQPAGNTTALTSPTGTGSGAVKFMRMA